MCLETGFLSFPPTTAIVLEQNNFCGFGTTSSMSVGESFKDMRTGVRVQVQHLKAYATTEATRRRNIDPRRHLVRLGSAPTVMKLSGKWATDPGYGEKLCVFLDRLRNE
jgi:hypothetical protein